MARIKFLTNLDWGIMILPLLIGIYGLLVLSSAGFDPDTGVSRSFLSQSVYMLLGWLIFLVSALISPSMWKRLSIPVYIFGIALLFYIVIKGGIVAGGARRWIALGPVRLQPSEVMKIGIILILARLFGGKSVPEGGYTLKSLGKPFFLMLIPAVIIMKQPDLGTALCLLAIGGSMLFIAGLRFRTIFILLIPLVILAVPLWHYGMKDYQRQRVLTFISPERDPMGRGYHSMQSRIAVGSGAVFGKGYKKGTQTQLRFLPEQTTDFVFSVLAEEWGFVGSAIAISLYLFLVHHLFSLATRFDDMYCFYVTIGTASLIFWHMFINIGMVIGVLPVVGITLALFSYGGSSLITTMCLLGMVAGFSARRYMFS